MENRGFLVREKARFTHVIAILRLDVRGKRFSAHGKPPSMTAPRRGGEDSTISLVVPVTGYDAAVLIQIHSCTGCKLTFLLLKHLLVMEIPVLGVNGDV